MNRRTAVLVPTGVANTASISAALHRAEIDGRFAGSAQDVVEAPLVVLPGVGAFDAGREALARDGYDEAIRRRVEMDRPTLAVCLGFQLLLEGSDESRRGLSGLGIIPGRAERLGDSVRVPHLGWNEVECDPSAGLLETGAAAFAHSYCLRTAPDGFEVAMCTYDLPFVAAVARGSLLACQFHPELSGAYGRRLIDRFCARAMEGVA